MNHCVRLLKSIAKSEEEDILDFFLRVKCCIILIEQDSLASIPKEMSKVSNGWLKLLFLHGLSDTEKQEAVQTYQVQSIEGLVDVLLEVTPRHGV